MSKTNKEEPIRVAQIMGKWLGGGVESMVMNYYRYIDRDKIQFDFICDEDSTDIPYQEIESLGGRVIICPPYQKLPKYIKELKRIFKENNYKIVHSHINTLSIFPLYAAKKSAVPVRIAHSHSTTSPKEFKKNLIKNTLKNFSKLFANIYFACSKEAAIYQFGKKAYYNNQVLILNNGIDVEKFTFDKKIRKEIREKLGYKDADFVIGHIGRFVKVKNHDFVVNVFNKLHNENDNYKLMLVGQGPLMETVKNKVDKLGLAKSVSFLGQRIDTNKLYQAMDLLLFPSLYEGFGMVMIEAQCAGLPCVTSTEVPKIVKISDHISFISLNENIDCWTDKVKKLIKVDRKTKFNKQLELYNIKNQAIKLEDEYLKYMKDIKSNT